MSNTSTIVHVLDDRALGGVTRALENFQHPRLNTAGNHQVIDLLKLKAKNLPRNSLVILHFTASWKKLPYLFALKTSKRYIRQILIEHTYTRGFEAHCVGNVRRFRRMLRLAYRLVDRVVAVSEDQHAWMLEARLADPQKIWLIPQARDCSDLFDLQPPTRKHGPLRIGAYGRFHEQKGFDLLIEAMAMIPASVANLRIAGYGEDIEALKEKAAALAHVSLEPAFASPNSFLAASDVVVIPSRWEAFGLVGAEARAAGRPLIVANIDGLASQVGDHSWSHAVGDVADLRRAIMAAAAAPDLVERGIRARRHVAQEFPNMLKRWTELFLQMPL